MKEDFAFWTIAPNEDARAAVTAMVASAAKVGVFKEFHVWARAEVEGAINHPLGESPLRGGFYRVALLSNLAGVARHEHFVWLDPDTLFERHPGAILNLLCGAPLHVPLTFELNAVGTEGQEWHGCPHCELVRLMRISGVTNRTIYAASTTFFIINRFVIPSVYQLTQHFRNKAKASGWDLPVAPLMAYAMQMLCADPKDHCAKDFDERK